MALIKKRNSYDEFYFKAFFDGPTADLYEIFAALISPPERVGEVCRRAFSRTNSRFL
jgi:hypothetical protein